MNNETQNTLRLAIQYCDMLIVSSRPYEHGGARYTEEDILDIRAELQEKLGSESTYNKRAIIKMIHELCIIFNISPNI